MVHPTSLDTFTREYKTAVLGSLAKLVKCSYDDNIVPVA